jgi:hypothetical protein
MEQCACRFELVDFITVAVRMTIMNTNNSGKFLSIKKFLSDASSGSRWLYTKILQHDPARRQLCDEAQGPIFGLDCRAVVCLISPLRQS